MENSKKFKINKKIVIIVSVVLAIIIVLSASLCIFLFFKDKNSKKTSNNTSNNTSSSALTSSENVSSNKNTSSKNTSSQALVRPEKITKTYTFYDKLTMPEFELNSFYDSSSSKRIWYQLLLPDDYSNSKRYPVLFFLHGAGEIGNDYQKTLRNLKKLFEINGDIAREAIIVAPQCPEGGWWSLDETNSGDGWLSCAFRLLQTIPQNYSVDTNRIYVTGLSMGGQATWSVLQRYGDYFAAGVPICGWGDTSKGYELSKIPIWIYHGVLDDTVSISSSDEMYNAILKAGGNKIHYTRVPNAKHNSWSAAFSDRELISWLFAQNKATNPNGRYTYISPFRVTDANGKTVISKEDISRVRYKYGDGNNMSFELKLYSESVQKLKNAYLNSNGREFTVYYGTQMLYKYTATQEPVDDLFIIDGVFSANNFMKYYENLVNPAIK